jgi:hypothetical protein
MPLTETPFGGATAGGVVGEHMHLVDHRLAEKENP